MKDHIKKLKLLGACSDGIAFAEKYETWQEVWDNISRGDWSLWFLGKNAGKIGSPERLKLVGIAAECAELVLPIYEKRYSDDKRVRKCIETLKRYAIGKATLEEVKAARKNAAYADDAYAYAAADAAYAAADAAAAAAAADAAAYAAAAR